MNKLALLALLALFALALGSARASAATLDGTSSRGAVFVETNGLAGNNIVSYQRAADGSLTWEGTFPTGGLGGAQDGAAVDKLASQGALALDGEHNLLLAVNAGSRSVSVFSVDGARLELLQVVGTNGDFPSSLAVHDDIAYVLNAGGAGSIQGFRITGSHLTQLHDGWRSLGLANANPPFFLTSPGEVGFSPDGAKLLVTTKASTSSIEVFAVGANGSLSATPIVNVAATPVPFAFAFDSASRLVSAEAGASAVTTYTLDAGGTLSSPQSQGDGQAALCWIIGVNSNFYVANAGSDSISGYRVDSAGKPSLIGESGIVGHTEAGAIDMAASSDGKFLYAESGGAGTVDVFATQPDGTLIKLAVVGGLPSGIEGIAAG
jgi:DNA-binding beta-propeller fold protein YncE